MLSRAAAAAEEKIRLSPGSSQRYLLVVGVFYPLCFWFVRVCVKIRESEDIRPASFVTLTAAAAAAKRARHEAIYFSWMRIHKDVWCHLGNFEKYF